MAATGDLVLQACAVLSSASASVQQRRESALYLEQVKRGDPHVLLQVSGSMAAAQLAMDVQVAGYSMLTDLVKQRWLELSEQEHAQISQLAYQNLNLVSQGGRAAWPLKNKVAVLLAAVLRQQGPESYNQVLPQLLQQSVESPAQAEMACLLLHFVSEDVTFFDLGTSGAGDSKRHYLATLTASAPVVFPFLCERLQSHFEAAVAAQKSGAAEAFATHTAVIHAALGALGTWAEWVPMARVTASNVLDACAFFLTAPDFQLQALDVLKQLVSRRRSTEPWAEYSGLMEKLAGLLLGRLTEMGFMAAPGQLPQSLVEATSWDGSLEELGRRLCGLVLGLAEAHMRCLGSGHQLQLLQLLLVFTAHPYLPLPAMTLPVWAQLLREATPGCIILTGNNSNLPAGLFSTAGTATAETSKLKPPADSPRDKTTGSPPPPLALPQECCQALLVVMWELLGRVVAPNEPLPPGGVGGEGQWAGAASRVSLTGATAVPPYFDSQAEWREYCINTRGQVKAILRAATYIVPQQVLSLASQCLLQTLASAAAITTATAPPGSLGTEWAALATQVAKLDCAVHVLEATLPPLVDLSGNQPALLQGLAALCKEALAPRFTQPLLVSAHARCLEAFGKLLGPLPELAAPVVAAVLEAMAAMPLQEPGQCPPPLPITREWKARTEARLALANTVTHVAKASPAAFAPHLKPLADRVSELWDSGQLTEGERVLLSEGLLAAASGISSALAGQLVGWLLGPLALEWAAPAWQAAVASPQAFQQAYLPIEPSPPQQTVGSPPSGVRIGARRERWALYHQVTLLERAMRRTAPQPPGSSQDTGRATSPPAADGPQYPMDVHLGWALPAVAALMRCVHGLAAADAAGQLGPLQGLCALDEIEKAIRVAGSEEASVGAGIAHLREPRCVAGDALPDGRYLLRGVREGCSMILNLAFMHGSTATLWSQPALAATVVSAASCHLEALDHNHLRLLIRHVACQVCQRCPPPYQQAWVLPLLAPLLPHMAQRLGSGWAAAAATTSQPGAQGATGLVPKETKPQQEVNEVAGDVLLREVTREHMSLLVALTHRPCMERTNTHQAHYLQHVAALTIPTGPVSRKQSTAMSGDGEGGDQEGGSGSGAAAAAEVGAGSGLNMLLLQQPDLAQWALTTATAGLCWPDTESAGRAVLVCKAFSVLSLRGTSHAWQATATGAMLQAAVTGPMLQAAIVSLTQIFTSSIQAEVLGLLRIILVGALAPAPSTPPSVPVIASVGPAAVCVRATLQDLLRVGPEVLSGFETALLTTGSEKEQRNVIRQLVAQAGGDEVRKILTSVSKLPALAPPQLLEPRAPRQHVRPTDQDALLQGAIYTHLFNDHP